MFPDVSGLISGLRLQKSYILYRAMNNMFPVST